MAPPITIDHAYARASNACRDANSELHRILNDLGKSLADSGGMAGSDKAAKAFSDAYDPAAGGVEGSSGAMEAGAACMDAAAVFSNLLRTGHENWLNADTPNGQASGQPGPVPPEITVGKIISLPRAYGGGGGSPSWWSIIAAYTQGEIWPNGHQDKLRAAATAWKNAASQIPNAAKHLTAATDALQTQQAPEITEATSAIGDLKGQLGTLADQFTALGNACDAYAQQIDDAHHNILSELKSLLGWTLGIETIAVIAGFFSLGAGAGAMQAVEEARLVIAGSRVAQTIRAFATAVESMGMFGPRVATALAGVNTSMSAWRGAEPLVAAMATKSGGQTALSVFNKLRRVTPNDATKAAVMQNARKVEINGQQFVVSGADPDILIPLSGHYVDPAITNAPKVPLYEGGPVKYYAYNGHLYPIDTRIVYGHQYNSENWRLIEQNTGRMSQSEFNSKLQDPSYWRVEDYYGNASHRYEAAR